MSSWSQGKETQNTQLISKWWLQTLEKSYIFETLVEVLDPIAGKMKKWYTHKRERILKAHPQTLLQNHCPKRSTALTKRKSFLPVSWSSGLRKRTWRLLSSETMRITLKWYYQSYQFPGAAITRYQTRRLKQEIYFLTVLDVQDQGAGRASPKAFLLGL